MNYMKRFSRPQWERGAALVMALVFLLVLTILGVAAMSTSTLEERMAGNTQEGTRAFEAAESGITQHLGSANLDLSNTAVATYYFGSGQVGKSDVSNKSLGYTEGGSRGSGFAASDVIANFEVVGTGTTVTGARSTVHQGVEFRMATN